MDESKVLEDMLEGLTAKEAARLIKAVATVTEAARQKWGVTIAPSEAAVLAFVRANTLGGDHLEKNMDSALYQLEREAPTVMSYLKQKEEPRNSVEKQSNDEIEKMERIQSIENPALRMSEARKLKITKQPREILTPTDEEIEKLSPQERISYARGQDVSDRIAILRWGE